MYRSGRELRCVTGPLSCSAVPLWARPRSLTLPAPTHLGHRAVHICIDAFVRGRCTPSWPTGSPGNRMPIMLLNLAASQAMNRRLVTDRTSMKSMMMMMMMMMM